MKIIHKYKNFKKDRSVSYSRVDVIDRSGYISLDKQYDRLISAGLTLENINTRQYSYTFDEINKAFEDDKIREAISNVLMQNNHYSKQDIDDMYREKVQKYKKAVDDNNKLKSLYSQFLDEKSRIKDEEKTKSFYNDVYSAIQQLKTEGKL